MPEISDRIVSFDPKSLERQPVLKEAVIQEFLALGNKRAASIVAEMPETNGILNPDAVDRLLITVHAEMQRMSEEFQHGQRVAELLRPGIQALRASGHQGTIRVIDIGCGTGFVVRWLAAYGKLGQDVELIGVDYNAALVREAQRLAETESLRCSFLVANVFKLEKPGSIFLSTGVLHHFRGADLVEFFRQQDASSAQIVLHFDFQPTPMAPLGSWLFHLIRMRQPLAQHDGVLSAIRAHTGETLLEAARNGASNLFSTLYSYRLGSLPIPRVFHTLLGFRPQYRQALIDALGSRASRLKTP